MSKEPKKERKKKEKIGHFPCPLHDIYTKSGASASRGGYLKLEGIEDKAFQNQHL